MQRTKAGFGIILMIIGAIVFAGFIDDQLSTKSTSKTVPEAGISSSPE